MQMRKPLQICSTARRARIIVVLVVSLLPLANLTPYSAGSPRFTPNVSDPTVWSLVWSDEFSGPNGSGVDTAKWVPETGGSGWGNNELEYYTNRLQNADIENGSLAIKAFNETYTGPDNVTRNYTSARLKTQTKFSLSYGRIEARLKITYGQGMWPAFWMLGTNIDQVGWPTCGEMDIMENIGREPSVVHGTIHGPGYSGGNGLEASHSLSNGRHFSDDFHAFAIEWEPNVVRFYVDGLLYKTRTPADLPNGSRWVFDHPFFIILNVAVGGGFPGNPDGTTVFPQQMLVDYVRVYQRSAPSNVPVLFTDEGANRALALDSVTFRRDPFSVRNNLNFSSDHTTRLMLLSANLDLQPGDGPSVVTARADDGKGHTYPLPGEWIGRLPNFDWITAVVARLPDELVNTNQALVSVTAHNQTSNQAL